MRQIVQTLQKKSQIAFYAEAAETDDGFSAVRF